ncbi:NUDIX domain-containing protein [Actinomycetospora lutea]|uniref:NUDIX domain-containing protein n=1 Tax=Actinomycetospora lutea TaxID=663604 RepID=UPI0023668D1C|nr:NUDIX domain-containing protein [Actinomycetospora lutea]MDD7939317.1 NUDIX domain-containing protein [Actinomycetospora lutea]
MEVIVRGVVVRDGRVLLMQELAVGYWFFPGGHIEAGETPEAALVRELREELDVGATVGERLGELENVWDEHHEINHVFAVTIDIEDPVSQEAHLAAGWHRVEGLHAVDVRPRALADLVQALR